MSLFQLLTTFSYCFCPHIAEKKSVYFLMLVDLLILSISFSKSASNTSGCHNNNMLAAAPCSLLSVSSVSEAKIIGHFIELNFMVWVLTSEDFIIIISFSKIS